ncbi:unnamed protein product, partial [Discosporangium mesarthrocarpum]
REHYPRFGLKILIPGAMAGCLIGKEGCIINQLQTVTSTRIKLSQKSEFFPGTQDRVGLIHGEPAGVASAVTQMLRRLKETGRQDVHPGAGVGMGTGGDRFSGRRNTMLRMLVPLSAGGLLVGKGGENIKAIAANTGTRVNLAGKDTEMAGVPYERLCSVQGELESVIRAASMIVTKLAEDRGLSKYQSNQTCYQS